MIFSKGAFWEAPLFLLILVDILIPASFAAPFSVNVQKLILTDIPFKADISLSPYLNSHLWPDFFTLNLTVNDEILSSVQLSTRDKQGKPQLQFSIQNLTLAHPLEGAFNFTVSVAEGGELSAFSVLQDFHCIHGYLSLTPPLLTILVAVMARQVFAALLFGILLGSFFFCGQNVFLAFLRTADTYIVNAMATYEHAGVLAFTFLLGGMIGIVQKSGGGLGLAKLVTCFTTTSRRLCLAAFGLGTCIFFDDFTGILIIGNSLRKIAASLHVSKEKFAFIIHCMAVCMTGLSPLSSWIGVEIGYISSAYHKVGFYSDPFWVFVSSIPYRFFPLVMIFFVLYIILSEKDFGPMREAEIDCKLGDSSEQIGGIDVLNEDAEISEMGVLAPNKGCPRRWYNAALPFLLLIFSTFFFMVLSGYFEILEKGLSDTSFISMFSHANSTRALMWSTFTSCIFTALLVMGQRILDLHQVVESWAWGAKDILEPSIILILAWGLGDVIGDIHTGEYLASSLVGSIPSYLFPPLVEAVAFLMSFATGSAFGAMGILFPLVVPIVFSSTEDPSLRLHSVAAILGGSVFGNICSPIADNTILTSIATYCDITAHVHTLSLYCFTAALISLIFGDLAVALGIYNHFVGLLVCFSVVSLVCETFGFKVSEADQPILQRLSRRFGLRKSEYLAIQ